MLKTEICEIFGIEFPIAVLQKHRLRFHQAAALVKLRHQPSALTERVLGTEANASP